MQTENHQRHYLPAYLAKPRRGRIVGMKPTGINQANCEHTKAGMVSGSIPDRNNYYQPGCVI
jgi:hypothetical protein